MKGNRHRKIVELVENNEIETQEELADILRAEGFNVTQATVSRDIRQLNLLKVATRSGKQKYAGTYGVPFGGNKRDYKHRKLSYEVGISG